MSVIIKQLGIFILILKISQYTTLHFGFNVQEKSKLAECIVKIIEHLPRILKMSIITSKERYELLTEILNRIRVPVCINVIEKRVEGLEIRNLNDFVLILRDDPEVSTILEGSLWDRNTKFLFLCNADREMENIFRIFWRHNVINAYALLNTSGRVELYSFLPFQSDCRTTKPILLDKWVGDFFEDDGLMMMNEEVRIKNMNKCQVKVSVVDVKPMAFFPKGCRCNSSRIVTGFEASYIKLFAEKMNFSALYSFPQDGQGWGRISPPGGVVGEVYNKVSDIGFGLIAPLLERYENLDLSRNYHGTECITFAVPSGSGKRPLSWLNKISGHKTIPWLFILISLLTVTVVFWLGSNITLTSSLFYIYTVCVSQTVKPPKKPVLRRLMAFWIIFSRITADLYEASLGSQITVPLDPPEIETYRQLVDSDLRFLGLKNMREVLSANRENIAIMEVLQKLQHTEIDIDAAVDQMARIRQIAYIRHKSTFTYHILENSKAKGNIRILKECAYEYYPVFALQRNSPLANRLNQLLTIIFESGIGSYWKSSFIYEERESELHFKPFDVKQSVGIFTVLLTGLSIALAIFLAEMGTGFAKRRRLARRRNRKTRKQKKVVIMYYSTT